MEVAVQNKPFLRWAGGKNWFLKDIDKFLPRSGYQSYHELFLGGGSVFFHLEHDGISYLNDMNSELINTYQCIKDNVESVITELRKFKNTESDYYKIRAAKFKKPEKLAAKFIYLNQTSFNGIYRVNKKGEYNVPYGFRKKNFFEPDLLRSASIKLRNTLLSDNDFIDQLSCINKGDLVFIDPPYTISHNDNGFFKYNSKLFSKADQFRLADAIRQIKDLGAYYILTNAAHKEIRTIFDLGDPMIELERASLIGGKNAKREKYSELIITNVNS